MGYIKRGYERGIPHEPGNVLIFDQLKGGQLDEARLKAQASLKKLLDTLKDAGVDIQTAASDPAAQARARAEAKPWSGLDEDTLLRFGVAGAKGPAYDGQEFDPLSFDQETREFALSVIAEDNIRPPASGSASGTA